MDTAPLLLAIAIGVGSLDWIAVFFRYKPADYVLKPATLALMIAAAVVWHPLGADRQWVFTVGALGLSLAGDVFLMLPKDLFLLGLAAFLGGHLAYIAAFDPLAEPVLAGAVLGGLLVAGGIYLRVLYRNMPERTRAKYRIPVAAYFLAISVMVGSAASLLARPGIPKAASVSAAVGAVLFLVSDALIGWRRFVRPFRNVDLAIIVLYHLGQAGLVLGLAR